MRTTTRRSCCAFAAATALLLVPAVSSAIDEATARTLVAAEDRTEADRARDERRKPVELLVFSGVEPGDRVADIGAGRGYSTELLARAVGHSGVVYGHNTPYVIENYVSEAWPERLARPVNGRVVRLDRSFEDPFPEDVRDLDLIVMIFVYHDTPLQDVDRAVMNRNLLNALRPGGSLVVIDHHAAPGSPVEETADTLHRIDEAVVRSDLEAAGFVLSATADFMAHPEDPRNAPFFRMDTPTDAFVHRWTRPE